MPLRELPMTSIRPTRRAPRWSPLAFAALATAATRPARAAEPTMSECLSANESAIALRGDHKLRRARDQALVCAASSCPAEVRDACQLRVRDINATMPSLVFLAKDGAGHDLVAVRVSMDGEPIGERLDGTAIAVDPGQHVFTFEVAGRKPVEQSFVISEGQRDRREAITIAAATTGAPAPLVPPGTPSTASSPVEPSPAASLVTTGATGETSAAPYSPGAGQRMAGVVAGAVGVVGLGLGAVFGGVAAAKWSSAKSACNGQPVSCTTDPNSVGFQDQDSATTMATLSTVSFIAGGVLAVGGVVVFLTAPTRSSAEAPASARRVEVVPTGGTSGAGMMLRGRF
jgi:hypothetical protein